jgi:RNA polymerase sigma-70 factor (ECF subfamily)
MLEDRRLLNRLRCGDRDALRLIYEKYKTDMFTVAVSLLHDRHAAEDCLQDVLADFVETARSLVIRRNLKGYLVSWVANRARDHLRKKPAQLDCAAQQPSCPAASSDPVGQAINNEQSRRVLAAVANLPYEQREVFVLHVQAGLKFREIAKLQDVSIKTVLSRYRYGIKKMQTLLDKEQYDGVRK